MLNLKQKRETNKTRIRSLRKIPTASFSTSIMYIKLLKAILISASHLGSLSPKSKMESCRLPFSSEDKTPEEDPEIVLDEDRGLESMTSPASGGYGRGGRQSSHDHDSVHGEDSNDSSPTGFPEESSPDQNRLHSVMKMFDLAIPLVTYLLAYRNPLFGGSSFRLLLFLIWATKFSAPWFGNLMHDYYFFANNIEFLGYGFMLTAFYSTVASFIGFSLLALIPVLCLIASVVALHTAFFNGNSVSGN